MNNNVLLAIGNRPLEEYLKSNLDNEFNFVGEAAYLEATSRLIEEKLPDILILRESIVGNTPITKFVYEIKKQNPLLRIIFIAGNRKQGDALLETLVSYGVYDIIVGKSLNASDISNLLHHPNTFKDVAHFQRVKIVDKDEVAFEVPEAEVIERNIVHNVYVDTSSRDGEVENYQDYAEASSEDYEPISNNYENNDSIENQEEPIYDEYGGYYDVNGGYYDATGYYYTAEELEEMWNNNYEEAANGTNETENYHDTYLYEDLENNGNNPNPKSKFNPIEYEEDDINSRENNTYELEEEIFEIPNTSQSLQDNEKTNYSNTQNEANEYAYLLEKEKIEKEFALKEKEFALKEQEMKMKQMEAESKQRELALKEKEIELEAKRIASQKEVKIENSNEDNEKKVQEKHYEKIFSNEQINRLSANSGDKIITVLGAKNGVGATAIGVNLAVSLAQKGKRVLYIEYNKHFSASNYWYNIGHINKGIDTALQGLKRLTFEGIEEAIVRMIQEKERTKEEGNPYKNFPNQLDFMYFSKTFIYEKDYKEKSDAIDESLTDKLFLYFSFQSDYDHIIIDIDAKLHEIATLHALTYSNKIFMVLNQDISTIATTNYLLNEIIKKGIQIQNRLTLIVNHYDKTLSIKKIKDLIDYENILTVSNYNKEFTNANYKGIPVIIDAKCSSLNALLKEIHKSLKIK